MSNYRRPLAPGGTVFFTVVTFNRMPILTTELSRHILRRVWKRVQNQHPFVVDAVCLLPDHLHCMWTLPENDGDYGWRWSAIKGLFTKEYLKSGARKEFEMTHAKNEVKPPSGNVDFGNIPFAMKWIIPTILIIFIITLLSMDWLSR